MKKNIIANFIGRFWGILSNFLFIPLYIHFLGFESYSIISFTLLIAGIMAILDAGLTATLSREFSRSDINHDEKIRTFKTLESVYFLVITISVVIVFSFSKPIAVNWLNLKSFSPEQVSFFLKIISFDIGFQLLLRFYMGGLLGLEKQIRANMFQVGWGMLRNGLVVILIMFVPTLTAFFFWQTISTVIFALLMKISLEKVLLGKYAFSIKPKIEKEVFQRVSKFAGGMLLIAIVAALNTQMDKIAISKLLSLESLGFYTLAISLCQGIIILVNPVATALLPRFTSQFSEGKKLEASYLYYKVSLLVSVLIFSIMANMFFFAKDLIWVWTGNIELSNNVYIFVPIVATAYAMLALQILPYHIAIANGYTKLNNLLGVISLCLTLPGYWIVTKHYGALGAASIFLIVQSATTFVYLYFINKRFLNPKYIWTLFLRHLFLPLLICLTTAFLFSIIPGIDYASRIVTLVWIGISTLFTLVIGLVILIPFKELKSILRERSL